MIFSDPYFLFLFLPICFALFHLCAGRISRYNLMLLLIGFSIVFYASWSVQGLFILAGSVICNYLFYTKISSDITPHIRKILFVTSIVLNITLLTYFKYSNFFIENFCALASCTFHAVHILLPLGISFYTFQQIVFLVSGYEQRKKNVTFLEYVSFVFFFPHLVAGPIIRHDELVPQIRRIGQTVPNDFIWRGAVLLTLGLFKKLVIADQLAKIVDPVYTAAERGIDIGFYDSWMATFSFSFQIYFDFSAYTDMAIGLALLFGFVFPLNFDAPYQAKNIAEFWQRWHITLSRFLKDYVYIPLGGNRAGAWRTYQNLLFTMLIGGLWHGADWTFIIWGGLHGLALVTYKILNRHSTFRLPGAALLTFLFVTFTWVFFRAPNLEAAHAILLGMFGVNGFQVAYDDTIRFALQFSTGANSIYEGLVPIYTTLALIGLYLAVRLAPTSGQLIGLTRLSCKKSFAAGDHSIFESSLITPSWRWAIVMVVLFFCSILSINQTPEFIYFEF